MPSSPHNSDAPITHLKGTRRRRARRVVNLFGHFLVAAVPGFLGGLLTGRVAIAILIGFGLGMLWVALQRRFGTTLNSRMTLPADQVGGRHRRPHSYVNSHTSGVWH